MTDALPLFPPLEMWGGVECTYNRVGDQYLDQLSFNGHLGRPQDLERFAALGLKKLRYPVLWERVAPDSPESLHWDWADDRLARLAELKLEPIVGLLHHGSGPRYTDLADPEFANKFSHYARQVAARYPWVKSYTPINEPLTTARFSGLYGHWYPHARDHHDFLLMLFNQIWGTALAMQAIRREQPEAELILTEDLGEASSTPHMAYQATYENARRWLSMDLLEGHVRKGHPFYLRFLAAGIHPDSLERLAAEPCAPAVIGINHYLTSNRFLDERVELYPADFHGGNQREAYADVESLVVAEARRVDRGALLKQVWERYRRPVAITESHVYSTREEQLRWLHDAWSQAQDLRAEGIDVRAVTAWSLLGTYDWISLCTRAEGVYEPGVFDLRSTPPRPTAMAGMIRALATTDKFDHPVLRAPGWWDRPTRLLYPRQEERASFRVLPKGPVKEPSILIVGMGTLAQALARQCDSRGLFHALVSRQEMDAASKESVDAMLMALHPWSVINAAGYVRVDDAEWDAVACQRDNVTAAVTLAEACAQRHLPFVSFSSDLVFNGTQDFPYSESGRVDPLNRYGRSKADAERQIGAAWPKALLVRTSAFFGPWDEANFLTQLLRRLAGGLGVSAANDVTITPTYVPELAQTVLDLLIDDESGLWHLTNRGALTWAELAHMAAQKAGLDSSLIEARPAREMGWTAPRPLNSALASERGALMQPVEAAVERFISEYRRRSLLPAVEKAIA